MWGHVLLQSVVVLWLVQAACTRGYGAVSGVANGHGPQPNGRTPQNGGRLPSKGVGQVMGAQNGFGGYPTKGQGYGAAAGTSNTNGGKYNGYGAAAGMQGGAAIKGYGAAAGVSNGQRGQPQGYNPQAGLGYGGQANKGNGNSAYGRAQSGFGNGQKAISGPSSNNGAEVNGQGGANPMKGYGRPYGAGPGAGMGAFRGLGVPTQAGNQGSAYGSNGYGAKPMGGYRPNGGLGAGQGLGSRYGNGGMKGPKPGFGAAAGGQNGQAAKDSGARGPNVNGALPNGYGYGNGGANKPTKPGYGGMMNGYGTKPNGYNINRGGSMKPQPGYTNGAVSGGFGGKPKGYGSAGAGASKGNEAKTNGQGATNGAALGAYGSKVNGYGFPGQTAGAGNAGYGVIPSGKSKSAGTLGGQGLKGGLLAPSIAPAQSFVPLQSVSHGVAPVGPEPTRSLLMMVTQDRYQPSAVLQGKSYSQEALIPQATPETAPGPYFTLESGAVPTHIPFLMGSNSKSSKASGPAAVPQGSAALKPSAALPQGYVTGSEVPEESVEETDMVLGLNTDEGETEGTKSQQTKGVGLSPEVQSGTVPEETDLQSPEVAPNGSGLKGALARKAGASGAGGIATKGQGATQPDCGPSGVLNGQWMKIPRPDYGAYAGAGSSPHTKGFGAGAAGPSAYGSKTNGNFGAAAGGYPNGGGAKPSQGTGGYPDGGQSNGHRAAGLTYPYAGKPKQPGYGQGAYLGARYDKAGNAGKSKSGYGNGNVAGVQPDFASLQGQGVPSALGKSGGTKQSQYNGHMMGTGGIDGLSQFQPQSAGLGLGGKVGSMYGGMGALPYGGQNPKYGIGGLQFGGSPTNSRTNGAGQYGYGGGSPYGPAAGGKPYGSPNGGQHLGVGRNANAPGKYGYGRMPYEAQTAGQSPKAKSSAKYGSAYQPAHAAMGQQKSGKAAEKYGGSQGPNAPQVLGMGGEAKSAGKYGGQGGYMSNPLESAVQSETASLPYDSLPLEVATGGKAYVKGETPTLAAGTTASMERYDNVGYISGQVQPEVAAFPAAPTPQPTVPYPSAAPYLPLDSALTPYEAGVDTAAKSSVDSAPVTESQAAALGHEQTDEVQQMPQQIHIQQHLKLHFHPQGGDDGKYELNGFFGNGNGGHKG